jgi:hypothetical protein
LRNEARAEAGWVCALAAELGFAHRTLAWEDEKPKTRIQAAARLTIRENCSSCARRTSWAPRLTSGLPCSIVDTT